MVQVLYERCCALDVHKESMTACLLVSDVGSKVVKTVRTVGTMTEEILALGDWLEASGCTVVAMESTGVYWKPIYNLLEDRFQLLLVNAQHFRAVPGRKTDLRDAEWLADLLRHGLVRGSFVPDKAQRELRELVRYRTALVREHAAEVNRLQKILEGANIKLASVASNVNGCSARAMLGELVAGSTDVVAMADLAIGRLREKIPQLQKALTGKFGAHQRFVVAEQLAHLDYLEGAIARVSGEIGERTSPFEEAVRRLDTIPGVGRETAEAIVAEIGVDMSRFPSDQHLASLIGVAPGNDESAGKKRKARARKGNKALKPLLIQAAKAASKSKDNYLATRYHRLASRLGPNKAALATAHTILRIAYHLLKDGEEYRDLGAHYMDERNLERAKRRHLRALQELGFYVTLEPVPAAA
jgi:transposase